VVDVSASVPGPMADLHLLEQSKLLDHLPPGVGGIGDLAYVGIAKFHPDGLGAAPCRKPRGQLRPPEDVAHNTFFLGGGLSLKTPLAVCDGIKASPKRTIATVSFIGRVWWLLPAWLIAKWPIVYLPDLMDGEGVPCLPL
jgi:hypothetical protein